MCLFQESAKEVMGIEAEEYCLMTEEEQGRHLGSLSGKEVSVCVYSEKKGCDFKHSVHSVGRPHLQSL